MINYQVEKYKIMKLHTQEVSDSCAGEDTSLELRDELESMCLKLHEQENHVLNVLRNTLLDEARDMETRKQITNRFTRLLAYGTLDPDVALRQLAIAETIALYPL